MVSIILWVGHYLNIVDPVSPELVVKILCMFFYKCQSFRGCDCGCGAVVVCGLFVLLSGQAWLWRHALWCGPSWSLVGSWHHGCSLFNGQLQGLGAKHSSGD